MKGHRSLHGTSINPNIQIKKPKCLKYNEEICSKDCTDYWRKCDVCKKFIPFLSSVNESRQYHTDTNSYYIYGAETICDDYFLHDLECVICPDCFKKLKEEKGNMFTLKELEKIIKNEIERFSSKSWFYLNELLDSLKGEINDRKTK